MTADHDWPEPDHERYAAELDRAAQDARYGDAATGRREVILRTVEPLTFAGQTYYMECRVIDGVKVYSGESWPSREAADAALRQAAA